MRFKLNIEHKNTIMIISKVYSYKVRFQIGTETQQIGRKQIIRSVSV